MIVVKKGYKTIMAETVGFCQYYTQVSGCLALLLTVPRKSPANNWIWGSIDFRDSISCLFGKGTSIPRSNPYRPSYQGSIIIIIMLLIIINIIINSPPLWSSGQNTWLQIQRSGFDSLRYQNFWEVVSLERDPLSLVSTIEELLERKSSVSGLEIRY
jgi:hypothetical protein